MSEYQHYKFAAIDHTLGSRQQAELRAISTRATISRTMKRERQGCPRPRCRVCGLCR
jgi:hypothetical protein